MTSARSSAKTRAAVPQWSQPKIGWMTQQAGVVALGAQLPQWSQPKIGWMTFVAHQFKIIEAGRNGASRRSAG